MITLEIVGNFRLSIKNDTCQCILLCILNLGHCIFPYNTTREGVALKPQYLFVLSVMSCHFQQIKRSNMNCTVVLSRYSIYLPVPYFRAVQSLWNLPSIYKAVSLGCLSKRRNCLGFGMDNLFHVTLYGACETLSMLRLKLKHVSKKRPDIAALNYLTHRPSIN